MKIYIPWCEWDIGLENVGYTTKALAIAETKRAFNITFKDDSDMNFDECWANGYVGWNRWTVVSEKSE
jgi:hypothetical protein